MHEKYKREKTLHVFLLNEKKGRAVVVVVVVDEPQF